MKISKEKRGECVVCWLEFSGRTLMGISGYGNIPEQVLIIKNWFDKVDRLGESQIVLFPSLPEGRSFILAMGAASSDYESTFMKGKAARSRYSILSSEANPDRYLMIYTELISGPRLVFFLDFFEKMKAESRGMDRMTARGTGILPKVFKSYTSKLGFDFVSPTEDLEAGSLRASIGIWSTFIDSKVFQVLTTSKNIDLSASFLVEKVDLAFFMIDWKMIEWFSEVSNLLSCYARVLTIIRSMRGGGALESLLMRGFEEHDRKTRARLRKHPDLLHALDSLVNRVPGVNSATSYATHIQNLESILIEAVGMLDPGYVCLDEARELVITSQEYTKQIEFGLSGDTARFGSTDNYLGKCDEIFHKEGIYPEVRVMSGIAASTVLKWLIIKNHDYVAYLRFIKLSLEEAELFETAIPIIKKKNPSSPLDFIDAGLELLVASSIATMNEESEDANRLLNAGRNYVELHDIRTLKTQINWKKFLRTNDYNYLRAIYKLHFSTDPKQTLGFEEKDRFIGQVAVAFLEESNQDKTLDEAEGYLDHGISSDSIVGVVFDQFSLEYCLYLSRMLRALFSCLNGIDGKKIERLRLAVHSMESEVSSISETRAIILKTQILCGVIQGDRNLVERDASRIAKLTEPNSPILTFVNSAKRWVQTPVERRGLRLYQLLDTQLDHQDPWSRILIDFMKDNVRKELRPEDIIEYDAVVLVEGSVDSRVYPVLYRAVGGGKRLLFIDVGGWTNMDYFANARLATEFGRSITVLFDGDTDSKRNRVIKDRLVKELKVPKERIVTIPQDSLENFLLVPKAIKRAFPGISRSQEDLASIILELGEKKNKKEVLDHILKDHAGLSYNQDSAVRIANNLRREDINPELEAVLSKL